MPAYLFGDSKSRKRNKAILPSGAVPCTLYPGTFYVLYPLKSKEVRHHLWNSIRLDRLPTPHTCKHYFTQNCPLSGSVHEKVIQ